MSESEVTAALATVTPPAWVAAIILASMVVGSVVGIGAGVRKIYRAVVGAIRMQLAAAQIIHAQLTENGGSTLLDKVNRIPAIEKHIGEIEKRLEKVERATASPQEYP